VKDGLQDVPLWCSDEDEGAVGRKTAAHWGTDVIAREPVELHISVDRRAAWLLHSRTTGPPPGLPSSFMDARPGCPRAA
jgi:hypothetical protein